MTTINSVVTGSNGLLKQDTFLPDELTEATSESLTRSIVTAPVTSLPGSVVGRSHLSSLIGPTQGASGPLPVPVSRFRALESEKAMPINDTCGPLFTRLSPSAGLQRSLENKLQARMDVNGSPEYALTWKELDMPSGVPICVLRASARRIR